MTANRILSLKCPNCSAALEISPDMESFACGYCGSQQVVQRRGGTVSLKLVADAIQKVQVGTDRTAAELAIQRLDKEQTKIRVRSQTLDQNAAAEIRKKTSSYFAGCIFTGVFVAIVMILIAASAHSDALGFLLLAIGLIAVWFIFDRLRKKDVAEILAGLREQLKPLQAEDKRISAEIAKHKAKL